MCFFLSREFESLNFARESSLDCNWIAKKYFSHCQTNLMTLILMTLNLIIFIILYVILMSSGKNQRVKNNKNEQLKKLNFVN